MTDIQQTVYVVEDDEAVRDSLELLLKSDSKPVKTYENAAAFLRDYSDKMAGCIVLDIRMPGMDGMELQKKLNEKHSILPIIFVTGHGDVPMAVDAMKEEIGRASCRERVEIWVVAVGGYKNGRAR